MDWQAFYQGELQGLWGLLVGSWAFLVYQAVAERPRGGASPADAGFVIRYCRIFALLAMLDPIVVGPLAAALGSDAASTVLAIAFVVLGDFRVLWLVFRFASPERALWLAAAAAAAVPVFAYIVNAALGALLGGVPGQVLWLVHELSFTALAAWLAWRFVPAKLGDRPAVRRFLRSVLGFVVVYYVFWASCDLLILGGVDAGWGLRAIPNQLYYGWLVPFVYARFFAASRARDSSDASAETQASR